MQGLIQFFMLTKPCKREISPSTSKGIRDSPIKYPLGYENIVMCSQGCAFQWTNVMKYPPECPFQMVPLDIPTW